MEVVVKNEITQNKELVFIRSMWTGKTEITVEGKPAIKVGRNQFKIGNGENEEFIYVKGNDFKGIELQLKNGDITIIEKLSTIEYIATIIPIIIMGIIGGALGGAITAIGSAILMVIYRSLKNVFVKVFISLGVYAISFLSWYIIASEILKVLE